MFLLWGRCPIARIPDRRISGGRRHDSRTDPCRGHGYFANRSDFVLHALEHRRRCAGGPQLRGLSRRRSLHPLRTRRRQHVSQQSQFLLVYEQHVCSRWQLVILKAWPTPVGIQKPCLRPR